MLSRFVTRRPVGALGRCRRRLVYQLYLDYLEDRSLPSTFTVLNLENAGPGSLRQAILDANGAKGADVIDFIPALTGTIALTSGQMTIGDDLAIAGPGAGRLAVSGSDANRIFSVPRGVSASLSGLTLTHGRADIGGAILNQGATLALTNVVVAANRVTGERAFGGAVANLSRAMLTVTGSNFSGNEASGEFAAAGGALGSDNGSILVITDSRFTSNRAATSAGFGPTFLQDGARGGGVEPRRRGRDPPR